MENKAVSIFKSVLDWIRRYPKTSMVLSVCLIIVLAKVGLLLFLGVLVCMIYIGENDIITANRKIGDLERM